MGKKYKVYCENQFLGHYYSPNAKDAVKKAIKKNWNYYPDVVLDIDADFTAQKDTMSPKFCYNWEDFPEMYPTIK